MIKNRVVITGMGVVAPNAIGLENFLEAIKKGKSGIKFHKKLEDLSTALVFNSFNRADLKVLTTRNQISESIEREITANTIVLFMSSGNFGGLNIEVFSKQL